MRFSFYKYEGTGNDFIVIDNRSLSFPSPSVALIKKLCDRRFGIGADGLLLVEQSSTVDFHLHYFNSDGSSSFCGNGSRCAVHLTHQLGISKDRIVFTAFDGLHEAYVKNNLIHLKMVDVKTIKKGNDFFELYTGSPHYVKFVEDVHVVDVVKEGRAIRMRSEYKEQGINVNFVQRVDDHSIFVRTYERGVEDETLSCGTGVAACALVMGMLGCSSPIHVHTKGGELQVMFSQKETLFESIYLIGSVTLVFTGQVEL